MTTYRVDDEGYLIREVIDWKPTLRVFLRSIGFGVVAGILLWISPLLIFTFVIQELASDQWAWTFSVVAAVLTSAFYLTFMVGRRQFPKRKDGPRLHKHVLDAQPQPQSRDFWAEYRISARNLWETHATHQSLVEEMKAAGFDPNDRPRPKSG